MLFFLLFFQGCEAVYSSVSGLKAHLGSCTLVCTFLNYYLNVTFIVPFKIVWHRRDLSLCEQLVVLISVIFRGLFSFWCPRESCSVTGRDARVCPRHRKGQHSFKSYQLKNLERNVLVPCPYQRFSFSLSLSHTGPALSHWALNFWESAYMYLSGLVRIL